MRFCTEEYRTDTEGMGDVMRHITNYTVQKTSAKYTRAQVPATTAFF